MKKILLLLTCVYTSTSMSTNLKPISQERYALTDFYKKNPPLEVSCKPGEYYSVNHMLVGREEYEIAEAMFNFIHDHKLILEEQAKTIPNNDTIIALSKRLAENAGFLAKHDKDGACIIS